MAIRKNSIAENPVNREFKCHGPRNILLTDITYLKFKDRHIYLCTIMDGFTKQVLGYSVSDNLMIDFVLDTANMLVENHNHELLPDTIIHSDQGAHYTSTKFIELIKSSELRQSMSGRGNFWDNAPQESYFGHMKCQIDFSKVITFKGYVEKITDWIDYYNNERYQWELAKLSPNQYYDYIRTGHYPIDDL